MPDLFIKEGDQFVPYTGPKLIPESDLLAFKGGAENRESALKAQVDDLTKAKDETLQRALTAESSLKTATDELEPLKTQAARVPDLEQQLKSATESGEQAKTAMLTSRRTALISKYNVQGDQAKKLETMTAEQLDSFEETASLLGVQPNSMQRGNFDRNGNGNTADLTGKSSFDMIKAGLAEMKAGSS